MMRNVLLDVLKVQNPTYWGGEDLYCPLITLSKGALSFVLVELYNYSGVTTFDASTIVLMISYIFDIWPTLIADLSL